MLALAGCGSGAVGDIEPTVYEAESRPSDEAQRAAALPKSVLQAARSAAGRGHAGAAESLYWRAAALDPDNPTVYTELGQLLLRRDAGEQAAAAYRAAIRLDAKNSDALYGLGRAQILLDKPEAAANSFSAANAAAPSVRGYNGLGVALDMTGAHASAQAAYNQGLALDPQNLGLRNNLGLSLVLSGQYEEAVGTLRTAASHPLATPRERQNLALALGLSETPRLAARIGRLDLTEDEVADNAVLYERLREGPDRATLTALRRDRGGLAVADASQAAGALPRPAESASVLPLRGLSRAATRPADPVATTPPPLPETAVPLRAPGAPERPAIGHPSGRNPDAPPAVAVERPVRRVAPARDSLPSLATKDVAVPTQVGESSIRRGVSSADSPHPASRPSDRAASGHRASPDQRVAQAAELTPEYLPTVVASNATAGGPSAPREARPVPARIGDGAVSPLGWTVALALLFAALIALHIIVSRQMHGAARIAQRPAPRQAVTVGEAREAPAGSGGSICAGEEIALINALLASNGPLIEQAQRCRRLMEEFGYSPTVLAQMLGKNPSHVTSLARLVGWLDPMKKREHSGPGSQGAGEAPAIAPLPAP